MNQIGNAAAFQGLHRGDQPLVLYNIWDSGSASAVAKAGAQAVATSSWSMAAAHGYSDGEAMPLAAVEVVVREIVTTVAVPVTVDFEGAYAVDPDEAAANVARIIRAGGVGINFEDQILGGNGVHPTALQCRRIAAIRAVADALGVALFINARTDLFLQAADVTQHSTLATKAAERARAYAQAGASGFFVPGLANEQIIEGLCAASPIPLNVMANEGSPSAAHLRSLGVQRVSYGPLPYLRCMQHLASLAMKGL